MIKKLLKKMLAPIVNELVQAELKRTEAEFELSRIITHCSNCSSTETDFKQKIVQSVLDSLNRHLRDASESLA